MLSISSPDSNLGEERSLPVNMQERKKRKERERKRQREREREKDTEIEKERRKEREVIARSHSITHTYL